MDQGEPNLKVTDRRHFTADGDLKENASETSPEEVKLHEPPAAHTSGSPKERDFHDAPPLTFSSFIVSLATQAAELMSAEPRDLGGARQIISAIEMLKDKSEGRRTDEESRILDAVLFDLRLAFVGSAKGKAS